MKHATSSVHKKTPNTRSQIIQTGDWLSPALRAAHRKSRQKSKKIYEINSYKIAGIDN